MTDSLTIRDSNLDEPFAFETLLLELSSRFVNIAPDGVDREIDGLQRRVCEFLGLDIAAVWQLSPDEPGVLRMTHFHRPFDGPPIPENFDARIYFPWALERVLVGESVSLLDIDQAPAEAATDCETFRHFEVKSVFLFPLFDGETPIGAVSYHTVDDPGSWPAQIERRLGLVAQILASAVVRKRAESALHDSEERFKLAAEAADIGMWMLNIENRHFWATDRAREIFNFEPDLDITMDRFLETVHPSCREPVTEAVRAAVEEGREIDIEYRVVLPDGRERWLHSCGRVQPESATSPRSLLGATIDVTERKQAEEELQNLHRQLELENAYLRREHGLEHGHGRIVGESPAIMKVLEMLEHVAPTGSTVLIEGETGTGKELIAQRIHELSPRNERPMIRVNCAALPSTLVESELFGREKGAFTGAVSKGAGRFEVADGSTIFLDEISELPYELQSKLLRVLEEGQYERVGSSKTLQTDVRVIAATNRDLKAEVDAGRFRSDLYFRLAVFPIRVPPLRVRRGDVPLLVWSFVHELAATMNKAFETIPLEDMERLERHDWPGNVRELRNMVERAMILSSGPTLRIELPETAAADGSDDEAIVALDEAQRRHIARALEAAGGQVRGAGGAAELLGINPSTLRSRMRNLGIDPQRFRGDISPRR